MGWKWDELGWGPTGPSSEQASPMFDDMMAGLRRREALPSRASSGVLARGLDYSGGTISGATIKAADFSFVARYVDDTGSVRLGPKHITKSEYQELCAAGVQVLLVFEVGTGDALGGYPSGVANGQRARRGADAIGYPPDGLIFMAVDMHLAVTQLATAMAYLDGAISVLGNARTGVYGFPELIAACAGSGRGVAYWQCGRPPTSPGVHLWQVQPPDGQAIVGGVQVDINHLLRPLPGGDDLTPEQNDMLVALYQQMSGSPKVGEWPGWPTWGGGTNESLTLVDMGRRGNVETRQVWLAVQAVQAKLDSFSVSPAGDLGTLSDADVQRVAAAVVDLLGSKITPEKGP